MAVKFLHTPTALQPGDILLARLTWQQPNPAHWLVAAATRSMFVHGTMVMPLGLEWSVGTFGPELRPAAYDAECWAYRVNHPEWETIGRAAADWLLERLPDRKKRYDWEGAGFVGVQALIGVQQRKALKNAVPYCFEGVTDALWQTGFDVVPWLEAGAVLGADIDESSRRVCEGFDAPLLYRL